MSVEKYSGLILWLSILEANVEKVNDSVYPEEDVYLDFWDENGNTKVW